MNSAKQSTFILAFSYLLVTAVALYFSRGESTIHSSYYLVLQWLGIALLLGLALPKLMGRTILPKGGLPGWAVFFLLQLLQGGLGFAMAYFLFNLNWMTALAFPVGSVIAFAAAWLLAGGFGKNTTALVLGGILAGGMVIALRLGEIFGSLAFALGVLGGACWAALALEGDEENEIAWWRGIFFLVFLVLGRAAIQVYLIKSGYARLGVVITHPYTYLALFGGIFLPLFFGNLLKEKSLHPVVAVILLGAILPLILGIFIHVRPMGAYLLALVSAVFLVGILKEGNLWLGLMGYLSIAAVTWGLPLFKHLNNLNRVIRLEILGGVFALSLIGYLLIRMRRGESSA